MDKYNLCDTLMKFKKHEVRNDDIKCSHAYHKCVQHGFCFLYHPGIVDFFLSVRTNKVNEIILRFIIFFPLIYQFRIDSEEF